MIVWSDNRRGKKPATAAGRRRNRRRVSQPLPSLFPPACLPLPLCLLSSPFFSSPERPSLLSFSPLFCDFLPSFVSLACGSPFSPPSVVLLSNQANQIASKKRGKEEDRRVRPFCDGFSFSLLVCVRLRLLDSSRTRNYAVLARHERIGR